MAIIDIGPPATDRASALAANFTDISLDNPANDSGTLTKFEFWFYSNAGGVKAGTFYGTPPNFTPRDYETIGDVTSGSKQTFSGLDCDVTSGDYIGGYRSSGTIENDASGYAGIYWKSGDQFGAGQQSYTLEAGDAQSLYGEGETAVEGLSIPIAMHHYKMIAGAS